MEAYREERVAYIEGQMLRIFQNNTAACGSMVSPHWHNACEALYVRRGWGRQRLNADSITIYPGDAVLICPGDIHETEALSPDGMDIDVIQFAADAPLGTAVLWQEMKSVIIRPGDSAFRRLFDAFFRYSEDKGPEKTLLLSGLTQVLLAFFMRGREKEQPIPRSDFIEKILGYAEGAQDLRLEKTAEIFGYCPEHLSRRFHAEMGISYRAYCEQIRMRRATVLLHREDGSISSVAEQLGYSDDNSFIRAFRRVYGITPGAYRRLCLPVGSRAEQMMR